MRLPDCVARANASAYRRCTPAKACAPANESPTIHAIGTIHSARPNGVGSKYSVKGTSGHVRSANAWVGLTAIHPGDTASTASTFHPPSPRTSRTDVASAHASTSGSRRYFSDVHAFQPFSPAPACSKCTCVVLVVATPRDGSTVTCETPGQGDAVPSGNGSVDTVASTSWVRGWRRTRIVVPSFVWPHSNPLACDGGASGRNGARGSPSSGDHAHPCPTNNAASHRACNPSQGV